MDPEVATQPNQQIANIEIENISINYIKNPNDPYSKDIVPGVYEGGLKIWECTIDLLKYMKGNSSQFQDKSVLEIGCGHGIIGIASLKLGAQQCCFQDFNKDVIENVTAPNSALNNLQAKHCTYLYGEWDQMDFKGKRYDIILGSQVIYRQENYLKLIFICKRALKKEGKCILANKHYYFGVGGNMPAFKELIQSEKMCWESLEKITPLKGGNKKEIIQITFENEN